MSSLGIRRDVAWLAAGYVGRSAAYGLLTAVLARGLGPGRFGELSLFLAAATGIAYLAGSWPFLAVPILVAEGHTIPDVLRPALGVALTCAVVSTAIVLPFAGGVVRDGWALGLVVAYGFALLGLQAYYAIQQTRRRMAAIAGAQTAERLVAVVAVVLVAAFATLTLRLAEVTLTGAAILVCTVGLAGTLVRSSTRSTQAVGRRVTWALVARRVGPMVAVTVASYLVAWADVVILAAFRSHREVGVYSLAYQVYTFVLQLGSVWVTAALPRHAEQAAEGVRRAREVLPVAALRASTRVWSSLAAVGSVAAVVGVVPLLGGGYRASLGPLILLLAAATLLSVYFAIVPVLVALGQTRWLAAVSLVSAALNIGLDLLLVPRVGIWAGAIATGAQTLVATVGLAWRALGPRDALSLVGAALPGFVALVALCASPRSPVLAIGVCVVAVIVGTTGARGLRQLAR